MAAKVSSSGAINQPSGGRSLLTGKGGATRTGGKMTDGSAGNTPNAAEGSSKVRLNGRVPAGDTGEQSFRADGQAIAPKEFAAGSKQSFRPKTGGRVR